MKLKQIPGFADYLVSDSGRVFSTVKRFNRPKPRKPVEVKNFLCFGYPKVCLHKEGLSYKRYVHRLVLEAFCRAAKPGEQCLHLDGTRTNNNLSNLRWGTCRENQSDRVLHGTDHRGEKHKLHKLTAAQVVQIREADGLYKDIAARFNVSPANVGAIKRREIWGHVK